MSAVGHDALENAGAWVLRALPDDEAVAYAEHLSDCIVCREEVSRLQSVADALPLAVPITEAPASLQESVMAIVRREAELVTAAEGGARARVRQPRRAPRLRMPSFAGRPLVAAMGACLLLAVGVVAGSALQNDGGPSTTTRALSVDASKIAGATAELTQTGDDGQIRVVNLPHPPKGRVYQVWLQRPGQTPQPDAVFTVDRHGTGSVAVRGRLKGIKRILVTDEPDGGSTVPSRQPILTAQLA